MKLTPLPFQGAYLMDLAPHQDDRGYFCRLYDEAFLKSHSLETSFPEGSAAFNHTKGTIRGLHYQRAPSNETKIIFCVRGAVFDVLVDLRPQSPTFHQVHLLTLDAGAHQALYLPEGLAHGYQTLTDSVLLHYAISKPYTPELAQGIRFDDPHLAIPWPLEVSVISPRDLSFPPLGDDPCVYQPF